MISIHNGLLTYWFPPRLRARAIRTARRLGVQRIQRDARGWWFFDWSCPSA